MMKKIIIITGLTGSGKSSLALDLAKKFNGEIISADSVQVYKGLDIGSAKDSKKDIKAIAHHLIDIKDFNENYNVSEFVQDCNLAIENIINKGKIPIIVGGTGLYIKALIDGYSLGNKADLQLRQKLEADAIKHGNKYVWDMLNNINPEKAAGVHPNNLKRVIRYIELSKNNELEDKQPSILDKYQYIAVGLIEDRHTIYNRIDSRVDEMMSAGLEQEVKLLVGKGANSKMQSMSAIGYKEWFDYLSGEKDLKTTVDLIKQHTRNYCKRQLTFLKTIPQVELCTKQQAKLKVEKFLLN